MATPEQLLEQGRVATMGYLGMIDNNLTRSLKFQAEVNNAEVNTRMKVLDFAEGVRMNDAKITQMNNENEIRSRQFQLSEMMAPLQLESQRLALETQRIGLLRSKTETDINLFNQITKPYDSSMASRFASVQSPEYMRSYMDMKGKYLSNISQGNPFDSQAFEKDLGDLNDQYSNLKPVTDPQTWNPEVSHMLGMIDPNVQKIYEQRNPIYSKNANALAVSYVTSTDAQVAGIAERYGSLFSDEKLAQISINRDVYQTNKLRIDSLNNQIGRLNSAMSLAKDDKARAQIQDQYNTLLNQFTELENQNNNIIRNLTQGNYASLNETVAPPPPDTTKRPDPNQWMDVAPVMGVQDNPQLKQRLAGVASVFIDDESRSNDPSNPLSQTELRDIDMSWFENNLNQGTPDPDSLGRIKARVENGIEATGISGRFNQARVKSLLDSMDTQVDVPISPWLARQIYENLPLAERASIVRLDVDSGNFFSDSTSYKPGNKYFIQFGGKDDLTKGNISKAKAQVGLAESGIASYEAIELIINKMPNKAAREEARKELFAALTAGAIGSAASKR